MSQAKHIFTKEEGDLGARNSRLSRKAYVRLEKTLAKMHLEKETITRILDTAKVALAQPGGVFLVGELLIDGLDRMGYFTPQASAPGGSSKPPASPAQQKAGAATNQFLTLLSKSLPPGLGDFFAFGANIGANAVNPSIGTIAGPLGAGVQNIVAPNLSAAFLRDGLFAICMVQALGGGQGIATLGTAALAALK